MAELFDWRGPYLIPLVLMLTARIVAWWYIRVASEDAYITYRYARSLATGHGLVFNPNERVMGFSSPLWTVWNALGYLVTRDPVVWSRAWSILADAVTLIAMGRLISRHASRVSAFCFTFFFACGRTSPPSRSRAWRSARCSPSPHSLPRWSRRAIRWRAGHSARSR